MSLAGQGEVRTFFCRQKHKQEVSQKKARRTFAREATTQGLNEHEKYVKQQHTLVLNFVKTMCPHGSWKVSREDLMLQRMRSRFSDMVAMTQERKVCGAKMSHT